MNKTIRFCIAVFALAAFHPMSSAYALSGRQVYEKVHALMTWALDHEMKVTLVLFDKDAGTRTRTLVSYGKKGGGDAYQVLAVFRTPPDLKGVGFLVHARSFADRDLWAYFPAFNRIRRIPTNSEDDSFFGTDFSYDDFGGPSNLDDYSFHILREEPIDGKSCYVVEVTPKIHRKFTKYVAWVAKDIWIQMKVEYYQGDRVYREGSFSDIRTVQSIPTSFKGYMKSMKTGHKTEYRLDSVQYQTNFPDAMFTQMSLERQGQ